MRKILLIAAMAALSAPALFCQNNWSEIPPAEDIRLDYQLDDHFTGGCYSYEISDLDGNFGGQGTFTLCADGKGRVKFKVECVSEFGDVGYAISEGWVKTDGGKFTYRITDEDDSYYEMHVESYDGRYLIVEDDFSHGGEELFSGGTSPGGVYVSLNMPCTTDGILYDFQMEGTELRVVPGGFYSGDIVIPAKVKIGSETYPVTEVQERAFAGCDELNSVTYKNPDIYVGQAAFIYSGPMDKAREAALPIFAVCDQYRIDFVSPMSKDEFKSSKVNPADYKWAIFKQYVHTIEKPEFEQTPEDKVGVTFYGDFDQISGLKTSLYFRGEGDAEFQNIMFNGYNPGEIELLLSGNDYVATHSFPSFSRWKYPETEVSMDEEFEEQMAERFGRPVSSSRKVANLRNEPNCKLALVNFEPVDNKVMYALVWIQYGMVAATYTEEQPLIEDDGEFYSPWGVDYEGFDYAIPNVISISRDSDELYDFFLVGNSPESATYYVLRQSGDKLEKIEERQFYRYVD